MPACVVGSLRASSAKNLHNPGKLAQGTEEQRSWVSEEGTQIDVGYGHLQILMAVRAMNYEQLEDNCEWTHDDDEEDFGAAVTKLEERMWPHMLCTLLCVDHVL